MILVASPSKPIQYTPKGSLRRKLTLGQYTHEIDELYRTAGESQQENDSGPENWSLKNVKVFVRQTVEKTMKNSYDVPEEADLFEQGLDR